VVELDPRVAYDRRLVAGYRRFIRLQLLVGQRRTRAEKKHRNPKQ
jgi:hypothetical protein